jgi:hypothetical protein
MVRTIDRSIRETRAGERNDRAELDRSDDAISATGPGADSA